jgi:hypothetical protein
MAMANQSGMQLILDKLKQQFEAFRKSLVGDQGRSPLQRTQSSPDQSLQEYTGLPLEIGNELLITDDIVKAYAGLSNALGRVILVDQISAKEHEAIKASAFGIQLQIDMKVAQQMRDAYLRREQAWASSHSTP